MSVMSWISLGLIAGAVAKFLMPGKDPGGLLVTVLLGIAGALVGGAIATQFGFGTVTGWDIRSVGLATAGAILLLTLYRLAKR